jgi:hypothetical protein
MAYTLKFVVLSLVLATPATVAGADPKKAAQDQQKYCIQYEQDTGSRINRVECRTKAEWAKLGVYLDDLTKK